MNFQKQIEVLIRSMVEEGMSSQDISWLVTSTVAKICDLQYRIAQELPTSRADEPTDVSTGDSIREKGTTFEDLDEEIDTYMSHKRDCKCYTLNSKCPICLDSLCLDYQLNCCDGYFHLNCLVNWYEREIPECPLCRHKLKLENKGDDLVIVADDDPVWIAESSSPSSPETRIRAVPIEGEENMFRDLDYGFVLRQNSDGSILALTVEIEGYRRPLTTGEKRRALLMGLSVME